MFCEGLRARKVKMTKLCIISDTHENIPIIRRAVAIIKEIKPDLVVHCGDIISPPTLAEFAGLPMRFIFGNNDGEIEGLRSKSNELGFGEINNELELTIDDKRLYFYHGTKEYMIDEMAGSQLYDYVFHGHTHTSRDERIGRTRVINPGALYMALRYTFATLDIKEDKLEFQEIPMS